MSAPLTVTLQSRDAPTYEEFYGFVQSPFTLAPDPRFLYLSGCHDEAIRRMLYSIRRKEGFIILTGDIGTGKTTTCRAVIEQLDQATFTSLILNPFLSAEELLREVLLDFGVVSREAIRTGRLAKATPHELIRTLHEVLLSLRPIGGCGVLIIDEAQHLPPHVLEQIRVISNLGTTDDRLLQIVLVGQPNLLDVLGRPDMRQFEQRISLRATLRPLERREVAAYVTHRLAVACGSSAVRFDAAALDRVHALAGGVPRVINLICDRALTLGAYHEVASIASELVEDAGAGLGLRRRRLALWPVPPARLPRWLRAAAAMYRTGRRVIATVAPSARNSTTSGGSCL